MSEQIFLMHVRESREQRARREAQERADERTEAVFHAAYKATKRARKLIAEVDEFLKDM